MDCDANKLTINHGKTNYVLFKNKRYLALMWKRVLILKEMSYKNTLKNKRVNQHLKGPRSDSVFIVLHLPYYPAGANSLKVLNPAG